MTAQVPAARTIVENLAKQNGYDLVRIVTIDDATFMATTFIIHAAALARAEVIIAPGREHLGPGQNAVPHACRVLLPTGLVRPSPRRFPTNARAVATRGN
ncbi:hypothetical protein OG225_43385 (plasmid) [Nocardia sp. NBC_01377]|uniref:hypothetical protein n=1 Tax=Nocardia sp. NBC_01377 TaxID=2903595 RepID=UPI002F914601